MQRATAQVLAPAAHLDPVGIPRGPTGPFVTLATTCLTPRSGSGRTTHGASAVQETAPDGGDSGTFWVDPDRRSLLRSKKFTDPSRKEGRLFALCTGSVRLSFVLSLAAHHPDRPSRPSPGGPSDRRSTPGDGSTREGHIDAHRAPHPQRATLAEAPRRQAVDGAGRVLAGSASLLSAAGGGEPARWPRPRWSRPGRSPT